jgi:hypothetical protein
MLAAAKTFHESPSADVGAHLFPDGLYQLSLAVYI